MRLGLALAVTLPQATSTPPAAVGVITGISRAVSDPVGKVGGVVDIVITGTDFTGTTNVKFGATNATATVNGDTQITAEVPAHAVGSAAITVYNADSVASNAFPHEYWDPSVPGCTSFARRPDYAVAAGTGTWTARIGSNIVESALEPAAAAGAPDFAGGTNRLAMPNHVGALFGSVASVGGTFACVIDLDAYVAGVANTIVSNDLVSWAVLLEPGPVAKFYYTDGTYKNADIAVPATGRIVLVCRRNVTGTPFIEITKDGGATWVGSVGTTAVGNLINPTSPLYLGYQGFYPLDAKFLVEAFAVTAWSNANVAKFLVWSQSLFP